MSGRENKKILILGGSSFVGRNLFRRLGSNKAIATYCRNSLSGGVYFDSVSMELTDIIKDPQDISYAVILLGDTNPETCVEDIAKSQLVNVDSIKSLLDDLKKWHIKPIFTSSEFVFDGAKGNYIETDPVNPILVYGRQKVEIEKHLTDNFDEFAILRLAKVFGSGLNDGTIFSKWIKTIKSNPVINCAADQIFSPVYIDDVVSGIIAVINGRLNGIFHLAGKVAYARIDLLKMLISYSRPYLPHEVTIVPRSIYDFNLREKRPLNVSMRSDKIVKAAGLEISDTEQICQRIVRRAFKGDES